jgi:hypothetical protein
VDVIKVLLGMLAAAMVTSSAGFAVYKGDGVRFEYPRAWHVQRVDDHALHWRGIADVGTDPMHAPCTTTGTSKTCGWPLERLSRGGVVVTIGELAGVHSRTTYRTASLARTRPGACAQVGADETLSTSLARGGNRAVSVVACLRKPGLARKERQVLHLVRTLRLN